MRVMDTGSPATRQLGITQVVALADDLGSYGGPLAVAEGQVQGLLAAGHDAVLVAGGDRGTRGDARRRLFRSYRVIPNGKPSGRFSPRLVLHVAREARRRDIVHIHLGRDLTTLLAAYLATYGRARLVVQTHGMVVETGVRALRMLDRLLTRRVLARAHRCLALTEAEEASLRSVSQGHACIERLGNGIGLHEDLFDRPRHDEVLFLSRLAERKRPLAFVAMAHLLIRRGTRTRFTLVGADEGQLAPVLAALDEDGTGQITYAGAVPPERAAERLAQARVLVLPSVHEPFPMVVLEALSVGTPVVTTDTCHIAGLLRDFDAASITDGSPDQLADAVARLLSDEGAARRRRQGGRRLIADRLSIAAVTRTLVDLYSA